MVDVINNAIISVGVNRRLEIMKSKFLLIAFIGPVGSGKTYIARIFARKLGALNVRTDDIRVALGRKGKSYSRAPLIAKRMTEGALAKRRSVILDFDAVRVGRRQELKKEARLFGARVVFIQVDTPEKLILVRLKKHRYTEKDLFKNAEEAIRVYFIRRKFHRRELKNKPDFVINNARPLRPQISKIIRSIKGK